MMTFALRTWFAASLSGALLLGACASSEDEPGGNAGTSGSAGSSGNAGSSTTDGGEDGSSGNAGAGGNAGSAGAAGGGGTGGLNFDAGPPVTISGRTVTLPTLDPSSPIPDMKVCVYGEASIPCDITDANGDYELTGIPGNSELLLEFTKSGFSSVLRTVTTGTTNLDIGAIQHPTTAQANLFASLAGTTIDPTKGQILALALQSVTLADGGTALDGQAGVTPSMSPKSGSGPYYTSAGTNPLPDPNATATSDTGIALFANVEPGEVEIEMSHPTKSCSRYSDVAWAGSTATASRVPVIPGYVIGGAVLLCPP